jgi:Xaa-Pro aminopeptidase
MWKTEMSTEGAAQIMLLSLSCYRSGLVGRLLFNIILTGFLSLQAVICFGSDNACYAARREALMKKIEGSIAVLEGMPESRSYVAFRQDNNFYYLTGVETPDALLLLDASNHQSVLFLPPMDKGLEKWEGRQLSAGPEARDETGVDEVMELSLFGDELKRRARKIAIVYTPFSPHETAAASRDRALRHETARRNSQWDGRITREAAFRKNLGERLAGSARIEDLSPMLDDMRRVKDAPEIERLRDSNRIAALGLKEAIRSAKPGMYEYQIAALAEFIFMWHGASGPAFFPIVGSGPNSCVLHYHKNRRKMKDGDIVVFDFGSDYAYYASDISRTFPISGRFSEEQAKVYQAVLDAQAAALDKVRPGSTFRELEEAASEVLGHHGYEDYFTHGVGHYVGMSVHDVGEDKPFEAGVVITVEPGVYMPEKNLGVRIEDTVLITKDGYEVLSRDVPKEISEIEKLMAEKGIVELVGN